MSTQFASYLEGRGGEGERGEILLCIVSGSTAIYSQCQRKLHSKKFWILPELKPTPIRPYPTLNSLFLDLKTQAADEKTDLKIIKLLIHVYPQQIGTFLRVTEI